MSKAGQSNFTGITLQADLALLYLLEIYSDKKFIKIILEGTDWEDFTLVFEDKIDSYEVKWHREITYNHVQKIIQKELKKTRKEKFNFNILCKKLNTSFKKDFKFLKNTLYYYSLFNKEKLVQDNDVVKKFLHKGWTFEQILFLIKIEIIEFEKHENILNRIYEHFHLRESVYLDIQDINQIVSKTFREIMLKSKIGDKISKIEFFNIIEAFKRKISEKSESFSPTLMINDKIQNIDPYFISPNEFLKLNHHKYLTPISSNRRLVMKIVDEIINNDFSFQSILFFVEKILIKNNYQFSCVKLIKAKFDSNRILADELVGFLIKHYEELNNDFFVHDTFRMLLELSKRKSRYVNSLILNFLEKNVLVPFEEALRRSCYRDYDYKFKWLPELVEEIGKSLENEDKYLEFLFRYFNFTGNYHKSFIVTPPIHYEWIKKYIKKDFTKRYIKVINQITKQYRLQIVKYSGYELYGSGVKMFNASFSINESGIVKFIFVPLFKEMYSENPAKLWKLLKEKIFYWPKNRISVNYPIFIKRACIELYLDIILSPDSQKNHILDSKQLLKETLSVKKGHPNTSEVIFNYIRQTNLEEWDKDFLFELVNIDCHKHGQKNIPTNIFIVEILLKLANLDNQIAKDLLLEHIANLDFRKSYTFEQMLNLIGDVSVFPNQPEFAIKLISSINLPNYFSVAGKRRVSSKIFVNLINVLATNELIDSMLKFTQNFLIGKDSNQNSRNFFGNVVSGLSKEHFKVIFSCLRPILRDRSEFSKKFEDAEVFKESIVKIGEYLVKIKQFEDARLIVNLLFEDSDPETSNEVTKFNRHIKIKQGKSEDIITTTRGWVCWLLKEFIASNEPAEMAFAFEKTKILLDLDGSLALKLGYTETDYYVLLQALVPLIEVSHPDKRKILSKFKSGLGEEVRKVAFEVLHWVKKEFDKGFHPNAILNKLFYVFYCMRDLTTNEAKLVLCLFEKYKVEEAAFLFIYFAEYRKDDYPDIEFNQALFQKWLKRLCETKNPLRGKISWWFWRILAEDDKKEGLSEDILTKYWPSFLKEYQGDVYFFLYKILKYFLCLSKNHEENRDLLFSAIKNEMAYLKKKNNGSSFAYPRLNLIEFIQIFLDKSIQDFFDLSIIVLENSDFTSGTNIYGMCIPDLVNAFKKIDNTSLSNCIKYNKIQSLIETLNFS